MRAALRHGFTRKLPTDLPTGFQSPPNELENPGRSGFQLPRRGCVRTLPPNPPPGWKLEDGALGPSTFQPGLRARCQLEAVGRKPHVSTRPQWMMTITWTRSQTSFSPLMRESALARALAGTEIAARDAAIGTARSAPAWPSDHGLPFWGDPNAMNATTEETRT
jgi:hypothetical protein